MPRRTARVTVAERLHRSALRLLRLLRREDSASGISAARLSALSVLVFGGPCSLGELAAAEQVSAPTMTRLVGELAREGWVRREADATDGRGVRIVATPAGVRLLHRGRQRRLAALADALATLDTEERAVLARALGPLERVVRALAAAHDPLTGAAPRPPRSGRRRFD